MKNLLVIFALCLPFLSSAQDKWVDKTATIKFESNAEVDDDVRATNSQVAAIFVPDGGMLAFQLLIKGFEFRKALMQEHFNENYMESDKYPKARFRGRIEGFNLADLKDGESKKYQVSGDLEMRDISKPLQTEVTLSRKGNTVVLTSKFQVACADYNIEIPNLVADKVAKNIDVDVRAEFKN